jgi:hypothetical protein
MPVPNPAPEQTGPPPTSGGPNHWAVIIATQHPNGSQAHITGHGPLHPALTEALDILEDLDDEYDEPWQVIYAHHA